MLQEAELTGRLIQTTWRLLEDDRYYIGLDVHKKTISYCVKDAAGCVHGEGKIARRGAIGRMDHDPATAPDDRHGGDDLLRLDLDLLSHAEKVKVAHPVMLRAIAAGKRKNDKIDASKIADCLRCHFLPESTWPRPRSAIDGACCAIGAW